MFRWEDMLIILVVGLFLFGPEKMVGFGKSLGAAISEFKKAANPEGSSQPVLAQAAPVRKARKPAAKKVTRAKARA